MKTAAVRIEIIAEKIRQQAAFLKGLGKMTELSVLFRSSIKLGIDFMNLVQDMNLR